MGNDAKGRINSNDRFVRWQTALRDQISFLNNLILTISIGITGYLVSLLKDNVFTLVCTEKLFFTLGLLLIMLSVLLGIGAGYSRLMDYRKTVRKIGTELKGGINLSQLKKSMKLYEKITWILFDFQIISFSLSILSLFVAFSIIYHEKIF